MTIIKQSRLLPFTCEQMYDLVNKVEDYAEFIPYCIQSIVHHSNAVEMQASIVVSMSGIHKTFTTHNRLQVNKMIEIRLVDGPFSHLEGAWSFEPIYPKQGSTPHCKICFDLEFEFTGRMISLLFNPLFEQISIKMVDAFSERAQKLYGV